MKFMNMIISMWGERKYEKKLGTWIQSYIMRDFKWKKYILFVPKTWHEVLYDIAQCAKQKEKLNKSAVSERFIRSYESSTVVQSETLRI